MGLFAREWGPAGAPAIVFLHGAERSGWSWQPVVRRLPQFRCVLPDLPQHGQSVQEAPFEIERAAAEVAELIRARAGADRVHLVGHSLGAQVGAQLLAAHPRLVDRAVLCGAVINPLPAVWLTRVLLGALASISRSLEPPPSDQGRGAGIRRMPAALISEIVNASAGFTVPDGLDKSGSPTLFLTGSAESPFVHQSTALLSRRTPNAVQGVARGMRHDWPLRYPAIFARTVDSWLSNTDLPSTIVVSRESRSERRSNQVRLAFEAGARPPDRSRR